MRRSNRRKEIIEIIEDNESSNDDNKIEEINQLSSSSSSIQSLNDKNKYINLFNISLNEDPIRILDSFERELKLINQKFIQLKKVFIKIYKIKQNNINSIINTNQSSSENKNIESKKNSEESLNRKKSSSNQEMSSSFVSHQNNNFKEHFFDYKQFSKKKEKILNEYEKKSEIYKNNNNEKDWIFKGKKEENLNNLIKGNIGLNEDQKISNVIEQTGDSLDDLYNDEINTNTIKRNTEIKNKNKNLNNNVNLDNKNIKNNEIIDISDNDEDENILGKKRKKNEEKSFEID